MNPHRYRVLIYWSDEDKQFIAEAPELPGRAADGETHGSVPVNLGRTIEEWIEIAKSLGRKVPDPCVFPSSLNGPLL